MKRRMIPWLLCLCLLVLPLSGCGGAQEEWLKDGRGEKPALLLNVETGPEETVLRVESAVLGETEAVTAGDAAARAVSVPGAEQAGKLTAVVTQNIDGLHQAAGSKNVYELHGSVHRNYCQHCGKFYDAQYMKSCHGVPRCTCGGIIKPDVVLYEESLDEQCLMNSVQAIAQADMLIIGGTSLAVYPAAGLIQYFRGKYLVVINKGQTQRSTGAQLTIDAPIGKVLEQIQVR